MEEQSPGSLHLPFPTFPPSSLPLPPPLPPPPAPPPRPSLASLFPDLNPFSTLPPPTSSPSTSFPLPPPLPLLRLRLIEVDSYTAPPTPSLDPSHSLFSSTPLTHVPLLRVYGTTPTGQHCALHIHRFFPYLYTPLPPDTPDTEVAEKELMRRLGLSLEKALREVEAKRRSSPSSSSPSLPLDPSSSSRPPTSHLYSLTLHTATDFYGYHPHRARFIKICFLSPSSIALAASILLSGALLGRVFQPYEAHIPYQLQFMVDARLAGMEFIDVSWVGFRRPLGCPLTSRRRGEAVGEWNQRMRAHAEGREKERPPQEERKEEEGEGDAPVAPPSLAAFTAVPLSRRRYARSTLPASLYASGKVARLTTCELECDCSFYQIVNRGRGVKEGKTKKGWVEGDEGEGQGGGHDEGKKRLVRSLQMLWENEKERRRRWREEEKARKDRKRQRQAEKRRETPHPTAAAEEGKVEDDVPSTPLSALDFSQFAPSPPRVLPPPSELDLALRRHLQAVARHERPPSQHTPPAPPTATPQTPSAVTPRRPPVPIFDWDGVRREEVAPAPAQQEEEPPLQSLTMDVEPEAAAVEEEEEGEEKAEEKAEGVARDADGILQSAIANADVPLTPTASVRLPAVSAFLSSPAPAEEMEELAATQVVPLDDAARLDADEWAMTQVELEMAAKADVDEDLLRSSQQRIDDTAQLTERTRQGVADAIPRPVEEEEEEEEEDVAEEAGEEEPLTPPPMSAAALWGSGRSSGSGRGRILIESDDDDDDYAIIPQLDGARDSEGEAERIPPSRPIRTAKYAAIPLTPMKHVPEGGEEKSEVGGRVGEEEEDVVMIPSTPPEAFQLYPASSPSPTSSTSSPRTQRSPLPPLSGSGSGRGRRRSDRSGRSSGGGGRKGGRVQTTGVSSARKGLLPLLEQVMKGSVEDIEDEPLAADTEPHKGHDDIEEVAVGEVTIRRRLLDAEVREEALVYDEDGEVRMAVVSSQDDAAVEGDDSTVYSELDRSALLSPPAAAVDVVEDSIDEAFQTQPSPTPPAQPPRPPSAVALLLSPSPYSPPPAPAPSSSSDDDARLIASHVSATPTPLLGQVVTTLLQHPELDVPFASVPSLFTPPSSQSSGGDGHNPMPSQETVQRLQSSQSAVEGEGKEAALAAPDDGAVDAAMVIDLVSPSLSPVRPLSPHPSHQDSHTPLTPSLSFPLAQSNTLPAPPQPHPPSPLTVDNSAALLSAQSACYEQWQQLWSTSHFLPSQPLQWVRVPLSLSSPSTTFVHLLATPPPTSAEVEATWEQHNLPPVINPEPFFSSLSHYVSHLNSTTAHIAVAHYQSSYAHHSSSNPSKSLVLPPPSAVDLLPPFRPLHSSPQVPNPPSVGFDPVPSSPLSSIPPLPNIAAGVMGRLFLTPPNLSPDTVVLEAAPPPPSYEEVLASLDEVHGAGEALSGSQSTSETADVKEDREVEREEGAEEEAEGEEEEALRPASPKHEENFLSTLSYFLPPLPRKKKATPTPPSLPASALPSAVATKRSRDGAAPLPMPGTKRVKPLFNLAANDSPIRSFPSPVRPPSSQLSVAGAPTSLPTFAPPPPPAVSSTSSSLDDREHLCILSVEMHACSRGDLLPDPKLDPVTAIICAVRWDVHAHDDERREAQAILCCPYLPQHGSTSSLLPSSSQCPPVSFPPSTSVHLFDSEASLLHAFIDLTLRLDPDLLYSYEIQKAGLGYIAERARWLGIDLCRELSRIRLDDRKEQWKRRQADLATLNLAQPAAQPQAGPLTPDSPPAPPPPNPAPKPSVAQGPPGVLSVEAQPIEGGFSTAAGMSSDNPAERYAFNHSSGLLIGGRIVINLWRLMRDELKLTIYTYENVCQHVLGLRQPHFSYATLTRWWKQSILAWNPPSSSSSSSSKPSSTSGGPGTGGLYRVLSHYLNRALTSLTLIDKLDLIGRTSELARVFGLKFYNVLDRGSQFRVESMMLRVAKPKNYVLPSLSPEQRAGQAGMEVIPLVMEPISRFYVDPVIVLDFQSLYPSMMIAYNICYSTCLGKLPPLGPPGGAGAEGKAAGVSGDVTRKLGGLEVSRSASLLSSLLSSCSSSLWISPSGCVFTNPSVRQGVLPLLLRDILTTRVMVKQTMRRPELRHAHSQQRVLNARQFGLKLISNVTYGYTAAGFSGRMPCAEIADAIVSAARSTLERAIEKVEGEAKWRAKVVYGDTDSLFVLLEGRTREEAFRVGKEMAEEITRGEPSPVRLQMEKVYMPSMLVSKKRYVGYRWDTATGGQPTLDAKGVEMVRRDGCPALVRIQEACLRSLFSHKDVSLVRRYVEREWSRIYTGDVLVKDFIFAREVRLGTYKVLPLAAIVATHSIKQDPRTAPLYGERVEFVVVDAEGTRLMDKATTPQDLLSHPSRLRLSATYYIEKQLIPPLSRLFDLMGVSVAGWYAQWSRPRRKLYAPPMGPGEGGGGLDGGAGGGKGGAGGRKRTIDHYYASQHCPGCDVITTRGYCEGCRRDVRRLVLQEGMDRREVEERVAELRRACMKCIGQGYVGARQGEEKRYALEVECESRDCSIYFQRVTIKERGREVEHRAKLLQELSVQW